MLFATASEALVVERAGLQVADVAPGVTLRQLFERLAGEDPELVARLRAGQIADMRLAATAFGRMANYLADGVLRAAETWQPDLVVYSQFQGCGMLAAAKLGVPAAEHGFGFARGSGTHELLREQMAASYDRHGVDTLPDRIATLDVAPPSMLPADPDGWSMRYVPYNGGAVLPEWLMSRPERPRIAVTLGTVAPRLTGLGPVERIIAAAG